MGQNGRNRPALRIALLGLMLALALTLSFVELTFPALPFLPPGVKLGLSNIVTMYCLFFLGALDAFIVALLKSFFVFFMRGPVGAALSCAGGLLSVGVMLLAKRTLSLSERVISILGALGHNIGQLIAASVLLASAYTLYYLPVMVLSGVLMGFLTGLLLKLVMPYLQKIEGLLK